MLLVAWAAAGLMWIMQGDGNATYAVPESSGNSLSSASGKEQSSAAPQTGRANPAGEARLVAAYGKLPLSFEANSGQADKNVKFLSHGRGYTVSFSAAETDLCFGAGQCGTRSAIEDSEPARHETAQSVSAPEGTLVRMKLVGANREPVVSGLDRLPGTANYFIGSDPRNWHTKVPTYAKVRYKNVYPGIDLIYYGNQAQLEYDFVVQPGADPKTIRLSLQGGDALKLDARGDLVLGGKGEEIRFHRPRFYQKVGGRQRQVSGDYALRGPHEVGFRPASYDARLPLMIDPVLTYSTYLGGNNFDQPNGIVVDSGGNAYVAGFTSSSNFATTSGAFQPAYAWGSDAFVSKLSPNGSSLIYSTYLGGSYTDQALAIAVDSSGSAYITGQTFSSDFPTTTGAVKTTYGGNGDVFLAKLSPDGSSLAYSTYLGGSGMDEARGIALDPSGNIYLAGQTFSTDFPMLSALQIANKGNQDAFVAEFSASGSLLYSTYLGGSGNDVANAIAVDPLGDAYVTGYTNSADFPVSNAPQATCKSCPNIDDTFVAEIGANGSGLIYSTYLGGSGNDQGAGIAVDAQGDAYVTGVTFSSDFPTTAGAYQRSLLGSASAFVTQVSANGSTLGYSTYLGNDKFSYGQAIAVLNGNAFVAGVTSATKFPTVNAIQSTRNGTPPDAFVTELNAAGSSLYFSTYLGGSNFDEATTIAVDSQANVYIAGQTKATNFPLQNPFQATYGGADSDAFVSKIVFTTTVKLSPASLAFSNQQVGTTSGAQTLTLSNTGTSPLTIMSTAFGGSNGGDFSQTNNCGSTVAQGTKCTISVTFTPAASGARSGTLTISDNASSSPQIVNLTGTAIGPAVSLAPASVGFANQQVSTTSAAQLVTLTNTGNAALSISNMAIAGANGADFAQTNTCPTSPATLAANGACTISVTFTPGASGARSGTLTITDNASDSPEAVSLTGTGTSPAVSLAPASAPFGSRQVGSTSAAQAVTLTNTGTAPLSVSGVAITGNNSGDFAETNTCGTSLPVGGNCTISVTFTPTATGPRNGSVTVTDNASDSPQSLPVSGTGTGTTQPTVTFTGAPASAAFQSTFTVAATTNASAVPTITASGPCSVSAVSGTAANTSATLTMTSGTGTCTLTANWVADSSYAAATATQSTAAAQVAPTVTFTGAPASAPYQFTFTVVSTTNASTTAAITASGACTIASNTVTMTSGTGACTVTANWAADNNYTPATASQSTAATMIAPTVTFTGAPASAPYQSTFTVASTTNASTTAAITASGACTIAGNTVTMTSGTGNCSLTANWAADNNYTSTTASQSTTATKMAPTVTFTGAPASALYQSTFTVASTTNASTTAVITTNGACSIIGNTVTVTSGTGTCSLTANWAADNTYTSATASQSTTAVKAGTATAIASATPNPSIVQQAVPVSFSVTGNGSPTGTVTVNTSTGESCNSPLSAGTGSCSLTFNTAGSRTLTAAYGGDANFGGSASAALTQTVNGVPAASLSPTTLSFGTVLVGSTSAAQAVMLSNTGSAASSISSIAITGANGADFAQTNNCGTSVAAGANCTISVTFAPTAAGARTGALTVTDNASTSPQAASLTGTGATSTVSGPVVQVQNNIDASGAAFTSFSVNITTNPGDLLVAFVRESSNVTDNFAVTDSAGQAWAQTSSGYKNESGTGPRIGMFYIANSAAVTSVTVRYTTAGGVVKPGIMVMEISGAPSSAVADGSVNNASGASTTTSSSGSLTTTNANDILILATDTGGNETGWTAGPSYTIPNNKLAAGASGSNVRMAMQYAVAASALTNATTTMSYGSTNWNGNIFAAFK